MAGTDTLILERAAILQNITEANIASRDWHNQIQQYRDLYAFQQYKQTRKKKRAEIAYEDPTYTNTVDLAVGILLGNRMDWRAYGWNPDAQEQKASSNIEKYLNGVWMVSSRREDYDLEYWNTFQFVRDGASAIYTVWDPKIAARAEGAVEVPDEEGGVKEVPALLESPLRVQVIDPMNLNLLPGGPHRWLVAVREEDMPISAIESRFGVIVNQYRGQSPAQKAAIKGKLMDYWEVIEITDAQKVGIPNEAGEIEYDEDGNLKNSKMQYEWRRFTPWLRGDKVPRIGLLNAILVDQQFIIDPRVMDGYEDLPYTVGFYKPVSRTESKDWGHGILHPMKTTVELLSRAINRRAFQLDTFADLPLLAIAGPGQNIQIDPGISRIIKMQQGSDVRFPQWPGNPPDLEEHIGYLRSKVQQSGFADVMMGSGNSQVSGYALSQLGDQNRIRLEQPVRHLSLQLESWAEKVLRLTKNFAGDNVIRVYGRTRGRAFADYISGEGVDEYMVECKITPEFPNEVARNHAFFVQTKGEVDRSYRLEHYLHIEQPDDVAERLLQEELEQDPTMKQYAIIRQLERRAANGDKAAGIMLELVKQQAMKNQGGRPTEPNAPPQMADVQSATGEPTPQEQGAEPAGQSDGDKLNTMINQAPKMV